jgi:putative colanic acid biosynthesis UDP-glucose lipid carrier transferase
MTTVLIMLSSATVIALVVAEVKGGLVAAAEGIVHAAAHRLPREGERWREEWLGDIAAKKDRPVTALIRAISLYRDAGKMRISLSPARDLTRAAQLMKRVIDVAFAAIGLVLLAPQLAMIALLIRADSPGPAMYRHARRGKDGKVIYVRKFRTMYLHPPLRPTESPASRDRRVTTVGRFLRRFGLDMLPVFVSLLRGDLTLVGPPLLHPSAAEFLDSTAADRPQLKPGLTGPLQLAAYDSLVDVVDADRQYVEEWSLRRDLGFLIQTPYRFLRGRI